jgi:hypothetical protein
MRRSPSSAPFLAACALSAVTVLQTGAARAADPVLAKVCGGHKGCKLKSRKDAGRDASGAALSVLELSFPKDGENECEPIEHWLVAKAADGTLKTTKVLALCNDGYGASGVGDDDVEVGKNRLTHGQSGGSFERWAHTLVLRLSPLTLLEESDSVTLSVGSGESSDKWSWETFQGRSEWSAPLCGPDGEPKEDDDAKDRSFSYTSLPQLQLEPAFTAGGWKTTALGACAARVDSGGKAGFVVFGEPSKANDARFSAVLDSAGALYLEIEDDVLVGPSAKWLADDHVELWLAAQRPEQQEHHCLGPVKAKPQQWAIRVSDGQVFPAYGNPSAAAIKAEIAPRAQGAPGPVRVRIQLPKGWEALTVAYSDGDDGRKQKRIIATSALELRDTRSLGLVKSIKPGEAVCRVNAGRLEPVVKDVWSPP